MSDFYKICFIEIFYLGYKILKWYAVEEKQVLMNGKHTSWRWIKGTSEN